MPGRQFSATTEYRYGFNGKEKDKDISEGGQDYGMRIYDSRLGRFLSVDPITKDYPWYTPYQFAGNNPIKFIDLDGAEPHDPGIPTGLAIGVSLANDVFISKNFLLESAKVHGTVDPYKNLIQIGRIFEDAVLRSLGMVGGKKRIYPYPDRPDKYFIPDAIHNYEVTVGKETKTTYIFENAQIEEVKFSTGSELKLEPYYNPEQLKGFITYLANVRGVIINGVRTEEKVADYGFAALILTTPSDLPISDDILKFAEKNNVAVLRRFPIGVTPLFSNENNDYKEAIDNNVMKVSSAYPIVQAETKKTGTPFKPGTIEEKGGNWVGRKVEFDWRRIGGNTNNPGNGGNGGGGW